MAIDRKVWSGSPRAAFEVKRALERRFAFKFELLAKSEDRYEILADISRGPFDLVHFSDIAGAVRVYAREAEKEICR